MRSLLKLRSRDAVSKECLIWEEAGLKVWQFWNYAAGEVSKAENLGIFIRCDEAKAVKG